MFDNNTVPKNLPVKDDKSLLNKNTKEEKNSPESVSLDDNKTEELEPKPVKMPQRPVSADIKSAEDIFADVDDSLPASKPESNLVGENTPASDLAGTQVETPHQSFKKVLITAGSILVFIALLSVGGYFAYNSFIKPKPLNPNLNLNIAVPQQKTPVVQEPVKQPPAPVDSDNDGLTDDEELTLGTDPLNPDSDGDRLFDREEVKVYKTDPLNKDTDGDGFEDGLEVAGGYDPRGPGKLLKIPSGT